MAKLFIVKLGLGLMGAWYAMFADQMVRWALVRWRFMTGKWKYISIR